MEPPKGLVTDLGTVSLLIIDDLGMRKSPHRAAENKLAKILDGAINARTCERRGRRHLPTARIAKALVSSTSEKLL